MKKNKITIDESEFEWLYAKIHLLEKQNESLTAQLVVSRLEPIIKTAEKSCDIANKNWSESITE